ncbi:ABC transporter permease [Micromonospora sp. WMMD882]|uniref:ABC transporter permease n=1 Tax=Micromonospora sp. WMMD882 TaxID=3015151 RepID=UPI00248B2EFA|nr:ABC transporter permease [Micromonospora sp. WMMD882]WBB80817.1 ABC transporter permease [Micromonospora sp. WMMD882]
MQVALRRARGATGLLLAAAAATLVAAVALTALAGYHRDVVDSGARAVLSAAPAEERSVLVRGPAGRTPQALTDTDRALREAVGVALDGWPGTVTTAGYAAGRQLRGPVGDAVGDGDGVVYAAVMFLDDLAAHARLTGGAWPVAGASPTQATLPESVAVTLGVGVGDRIPVTDGFTGRVTDVAVVGLWRPDAAGDPYWRLAPGADAGGQGSPGTYGPVTVHRDDFVRGFLGNASVGWLVAPDVDTGADGLDRLAAVDAAAAGLPDAAGLGDAGTVATGLGALVERIRRSALVGRSALITPMLLVAVLGGYTLLLVAALLTERRRGETALLRARGTGRVQVAALAAREAALVVAPAALLAPPLAAWALRQADGSATLSTAALRLTPRLDVAAWTVTGVVAVGCVAAMLAPHLRRADTYVADLAARSRPGRRGLAQRAGVDVLLVVVALLGWYQLRAYASPLSSGPGGDLGVDPLLAAAPTVAVLAGAVLALRLLPPSTRLAQRWVDRTRATAATLGMWQAGRRPHAGPVLLVALAVAVSALAWSLAGTTSRSLSDQADHQVGADLRLTETRPDADARRGAQVAALPGVSGALPAWRDTLRLGAAATPASLLAVDAAAAPTVLRMRADLGGGSPRRLFDALAAARAAAPVTVLPADARRLAGRWVGTVDGVDATLRAWAVFADTVGGHQRVPLGASTAGTPVEFTVDVPDADAAARLVGFTVEADAPADAAVRWRLTGLRAGDGVGPARPVDLTGGGPWRSVDRAGVRLDATAAGDSLTAEHRRPDAAARRRGGVGVGVRLAVTRPAAGPVPLLLTPAALAALRLDVGATTRLLLGAAEVDVRVVGAVAAVPGDTAAATIVADLPSLAGRLFGDRGLLRAPQEWWVGVDAASRDATVAAAATLGGLTVHDRDAVARDLAGDPFGVGARGALFAATVAAALLAAVGVAVDVAATARRRRAELAVLRALGAGHRTVTRSLVVEQAFLAGVGVTAGLAVGVTVAATMAPLVVLTPSAQPPTPPVTLVIDWPPLLATAAGALLLAVAATTVAARRTRRHAEAGLLRDGADR